MKNEEPEKFNWKQFFFYMSIISVVILLIGLLNFKFHVDHLKVVKNVEHCIQPDDIYLISSSSRSGKFLSITSNLKEADFIIRNKKQIPLEDICSFK